MGYGEEDSQKKKIAIIGVSSILLVAAVVGTITYQSNDGESDSAAAASVQSSSKAVQAICQKVDYKETCMSSLSRVRNTSDPKVLVKTAFQATVSNIGEVIQNSTLLREAAKDPRSSQALETCKELLHTSIDDFQRSFDKVSTFDTDKVQEYVADLKTWLSGAITYQQTCLDAFENTTGETGEKMRKLMTTATELSVNGLAMVDQFQEIASTMEIGTPGRKLLREKTTSYPDFIDSHAVRLLQADISSLKPNATIALDGSGTHKTFRDAINLVPKNNTIPFVIVVKPGVYEETISIPRRFNNIYIFGAGVNKTKITGSKNYVDGIGTFHTATIAINADGCILKDLTVENSAGAEKHQAVALRVSGDKSIIFNCRLDGYQDTLYSHSYRQFYRDTTVTGTIDFVFGDASAFFQNCTFIVRKPLENQGCMVTAQGRNNTHSVGALVIQNSKFVAEPAFLTTDPMPKAYLGRPWKPYSRTIIMQSNIDSFIAPEGWSPWMGTWGLETLYYGEYQNRGPGSDTSKRVTWTGIKKITPEIAQSFTPGTYLLGDEWIKAAGVPYEPGMFKL